MVFVFVFVVVCVCVGCVCEVMGCVNDGDDVVVLCDVLLSDGVMLSELFRWLIEVGYLCVLSDVDDWVCGDVGWVEGWCVRARAAFARAMGRRDDGASAVDAIDDDEGVEVEVGWLKMVDLIELRKREVWEVLDVMVVVLSLYAFARECGEVVRDARKNEIKV